MGILDAFAAEDRVDVKFSTFYDLEYLLDYHRRDTCMDYDADLPVVYLDDCYPSQMAAHHALDEEVGEDDC